MSTLDLELGGCANIVPQIKAHLKRRWGDLDVGARIGPGVYVCSGPVDILKAFISAPPGAISMDVSIMQVYDTVIVGLCLSDDFDMVY